MTTRNVKKRKHKDRKIKPNRNKTFKKFVLYNIPCILMGFARYYKYCHNIYQIITGYILGLIIAIINNKISN